MDSLKIRYPQWPKCCSSWWFSPLTLRIYNCYIFGVGFYFSASGPIQISYCRIYPMISYPITSHDIRPPIFAWSNPHHVYVTTTIHTVNVYQCSLSHGIHRYLPMAGFPWLQVLPLRQRRYCRIGMCISMYIRTSLRFTDHVMYIYIYTYTYGSYYVDVCRCM